MLPAPTSTAAAAPTILEMARRWALEKGSSRAFTFVEGAKSTSITFAALDRRAHAVARLVRGRCTSGSRVLLLYPSGLDYVIGLMGTLYAGATAVPGFVPSRRMMSRVSGIAADAEPALALTVSSACERVERAFRTLPSPAIPCIATDSVEAVDRPGSSDPADADGIALLQYTSGSTASPRGVCVTHRCLMEHQRMIGRAFGTTEADKIVSWLPLHHDMGLIGTVFHGVYQGIESVLMAPSQFLQRPLRWLEAIASHGASISGGPDFGFGLCVGRADSEAKAKLDLSRWRIAFNGSERVRRETMNTFSAEFAPCGFRSTAFHPCYGLAEATLLVTAGRQSHDEAGLAFASCGRPVDPTEVRIVDPVTRVSLPDRAIGEIWVHGPTVAAGYWRDTSSDSAFDGQLADRPGRRYLKTGDLGFMSGGELFPTGRLKDLIIVRGVNHFPEDLERTAIESHPDVVVNAAAAFAVDAGGKERVVVVVESARRANARCDQIVAAVREAISVEHGIGIDEVLLTAPAAIPRTSSGKIRRGETARLYLANGLPVLTRWTTMAGPSAGGDDEVPPAGDAAALAEWMARRLGRALAGAPVRIDAPLDTLGLDSLDAATFLHDMEERLRRTIPLHRLFDGATLLDIAQHTIEAPVAVAQPIKEAELDAHPLTPGQLSLWLLHEIAPDADPYRIAVSVRITGPLDRPALATSVEALVARHEALRTTFADGPRQRVHRTVETPLTVVEAAGWSEERLQNAMRQASHRPIDLVNGPVVRFVLYPVGPDHHTLLLIAHHIVCDGWSVAVLLQDLAALYRSVAEAVPFSAPAMPLSAYIRWQQDHLRTSGVQEQIAFWKRRLAGVPMRATKERSSAERPAVTRAFGLPASTGERLAHVARELRTSPFVIVVACLQASLSALTSNRSVVFGTDTANRPHAWMQSIVGMIANQLVLCGDVPPRATFAELAARARTTVLEALHNQDAPFSWVVSATQPVRRFGRNPLFELMFTYRSRALPAPVAGGVTMRAAELPNRHAKFDVTLALAHEAGTLSGRCELTSDAGDTPWGGDLPSVFVTVLTKAVERPSCRVPELLNIR